MIWKNQSVYNSRILFVFGFKNILRKIIYMVDKDCTIMNEKLNKKLQRSLRDYIRELLIANNKISVAPIFSNWSMIKDESLTLTNAETATAKNKAFKYNIT